MAHAWVFLLLSISSVYGRSVSLWSEIGINPTKLKPFIMDIGPFAEPVSFCDNGTRQSPIDITPCTRASMNALRLKGHSLTRTDAFTMMNTGHTAQITYDGIPPTLYGGPLADEYTLLQMHFHWGEHDEGSEHAIDGQFGALEAHFVHYKTAYGNADEAVKHEDGLAVVGVIFSLTSDDNPKLEGIFSKLSDIQNTNNTVALAPDAMTWVDEVTTYFNYFTYPGSLTTGPCTEVVTWIVLKKKMGVSAAQINRFRSMLGGEDGVTPLTENRRPTQDLLGRSIQCAIGCAKRE